MPRPKMPEGLYVSVSQAKTYLMCPRKYELKYIRGAEAAFVPVALAFGSAFHEALAAHYLELKTTGEPLRRDLLLDVFRSGWEKAIDGPIPLQGDEEDDEGEQWLLIHKRDAHAVVLVCDKEGKVGMLEDACCSSKMDRHLWKEDPPKPCKITLKAREACPEPAKQ